MKESSPLAKHQALCDDLYQLALEENRWLKESGRPPGPELAARKRDLLARLEESLPALRSTTARLTEEERRIAEQTKGRVLQFLHLDRENEQLLLRGSLARPAVASPGPSATPRQLLQAYARGR